MSNNIITRQEFEYLIVLAQRHFQFMHGVVHGLSYLLDPWHIGDGLLVDSQSNLEEVLINNLVDDVTPIDEGRKEKLYIQFTTYFISFLQQRRGRRTPFVTRCYPRDRRPCWSTGRPMDVNGHICKASWSVSLVWRHLVRHLSETSQQWASSIPSWGIPWALRLLRSSCSSRATWVCSTAVWLATTIPMRVIQIMPISINITRNKTMVLIQIEFYSFKP